MSTLDRARAVMREADAFAASDRERLAAAATWLRVTGSPLVGVYEVRRKDWID